MRHIPGGRHPAGTRSRHLWQSVVPDAGPQRHPLGGRTAQVTVTSAAGSVLRSTQERNCDETGTLQHHLPGPLVPRRGSAASCDDHPGQGVRLRRDRDRRQAAARQSARLADAALPRTTFHRRRRRDRYLRGGGQQRLQQPRARGPRGPDLLRARPDPHDGRPRGANPARLPGLVGSHATSAIGHLRHRQGLLADRPREVPDRGNLGLVPRGAGRVRPLRRRRRRDAGPAESQAPHQRPPRRAADGPRGGLAPSEGLPRRSPHARPERGRHSPGGARRRPAPGAVALRRRIRAPARRVDPRV